MNTDLISYYNKRASEYDKVYLNPDEQEDLTAASKIFKPLFTNRTVLEIACGTGYWSECISETAKSVYATDINPNVITIAKEKRNRPNIQYALADMYKLETKEKYDGLFGGFIWSHILLQDLNKFLDRVQFFLEPGSVLAFIDSNNVENTIHDKNRISKTDEFGNTFQTRKLENGTEHLVLKNFPAHEFMQEKLSGVAEETTFQKLEYYWIATGRIK